MKNHIYILSRLHFKNQIRNLTQQQFMAGAFISIHEPNHEDFPIILEESNNVLNLQFHDAEEDYPEVQNLVLFNDIMAKKIKEFLEKNKDARFWLLHCTMGISRSGAIGEVLSEYFEIPYELFKRDNTRIIPNSLVKKILRDELHI